MKEHGNSKIVDLVNGKSLCHFNEGSLIIEQGKKVNSIFYIENGKAKVIHKNSDGREFTLLEVQQGDYLGIHPLLNNENSFVSVVAIETVTAYRITKASLKEDMEKNRNISLELIKHLCSKIGLIESKISKAIPGNIKERIARILLSHEDNGISYSINELAALAGTTRNYVYRIISELEKIQALTVKNKKIQISDENRLSSFLRKRAAFK